MQKSRPEFHLGQEAVEGFHSEKTTDTESNTASAQDSNTNPKPVNDVDVKTVHEPLMECYPKVADDEKEELIADVRRHWLGRFTIVFTGGLLALLLLAFAISLPSLTSGINIKLTSQAIGAISLIFVIVGIMIAIGTFLTLWIYNQNRMLITDQNVIELRQLGLFSRKVSHLNMINIEDVSVTKRGIIQTMFDFGTMTIETAGEEENFVFLSTPTPDSYRRIVINAHERAIERIGQMGPAQRVEISKGEL